MSKKGNMIWRCSELLKTSNVDEKLLGMDYEIFNSIASFTGKLIVYSARDQKNESQTYVSENKKFY
jgi:hypothetical protein